MECPPYFTALPTNTCAPSCPLAIYTDKQYDSYFWLNFSTGILAIITSVLTGIPYLLLPRKRKWPQPLFLGIFIAVFLLGIQQPIGLALGKGDWRNIACANKTTLATRAQAVCTIMASWLYVVAMMAIHFWLFICIHLAAKVRSWTLPSRTIQATVVVLVSIGIPIFNIVLAISNDAISGNPSGTSCFLSATKDGGWWLDALWYIYLTVLLSSGLMFISIVCWTVAVSNGWIGCKAFISKHWRVLLFLFVAFVPIMDLNCFRLWYRVNEDDIQTSVEKWVGCLAVTFFTAYQSTGNAEVARDLAKTTCKPFLDVPSYSVVTFIGYSVMLAATFFPIIFFFQEEVIVWWKNLLGKWGTWIPVTQSPITLTNIQSPRQTVAKSSNRAASGSWDVNLQEGDWNNSNSASV